MSQLTTLTPEQARDNFYALMLKADIDSDEFADILQAADDWAYIERNVARQRMLTEYRNSISVPFPSTYPNTVKKIA